MSKTATNWAATALLLSAAPPAAQNDVREACMPDIRQAHLAVLTFSG